jgi:hypothetical protein
MYLRPLDFIYLFIYIRSFWTLSAKETRPAVQGTVLESRYRSAFLCVKIHYDQAHVQSVQR